MKSEFQTQIENVFRNSSSSDELFDSFRNALEKNIKEFDIYKILLANPTLTSDEIKLYTEKLLGEIPNSSFQICMWTAKLFESQTFDYARLEDAVRYYEKALELNYGQYEPLLQMLKLYNYDIDLSTNKKILSLVEDNAENVIYKSKVYYGLAELYKKLGDSNLEKKYFSLAERNAALENQ